MDYGYDDDVMMRYDLSSLSRRSSCHLYPHCRSTVLVLLFEPTLWRKSYIRAPTGLELASSIIASISSCSARVNARRAFS